MLALGESVINVIAVFALGILVLSFLGPILARKKKARVIALCGSALEVRY